MRGEILQSIQQWFSRYVDTFRRPDGKLHPLLQFKLEHSLRVAEDARGVARDLGWNADDVNAAEALGILHDVGRFPQFAEFKTLSDSHSVDHAKRSWEVVEAENVLADCDESERTQIRDAILHHNKVEIPAGVAEDSLPFVRLIRDADKLDIFFIFYELVANNKLSNHPELVLGLHMDGPPNPELVELILRQKNCPFSMMKSLTDFKLIQMSWVYDVHYPPAHERIDQRNVIGKLESLLPPSTEVREVAAMARGHVSKRKRAKGS